LSFEGSQGSCCSDTGWKTVPCTSSRHTERSVRVRVRVSVRVRILIRWHVHTYYSLYSNCFRRIFLSLERECAHVFCTALLLGSCGILICIVIPSGGKQVVQLSQRNRAAGWVNFGQKWKMLFCRQYRSVFNQCDVIRLQSYWVR